MVFYNKIICFCLILSSALYFTSAGGSEDLLLLSPVLGPLGYIIACILPYVDFPDKEPVFLNTNYELIKPSGRAIELKPGDVVNLACPGNGNYLQASTQQVTPAICVKGKILHISESDYDLSKLNCVRAVTGDVQQWNMQKCANGRGKMFGIGHKILDNHFVSLIIGCYDSNVGAALYTEHTIYGSAIDHGKASPRRPSFKQGDITIGFNPDAYTQRRQKQTFENYYGQSQNYVNSGSFLAKGHLSPDADFVYMSSRWATYFYVNVVPQWHQDINNRNWKTLEMTIRKFSAQEQKDFRVVTGSHGVLNLNGNLVYLDNGKLPVPALTWKVIQNKESRKAIGFITLNNAFDATDVSSCCLCRDISSEYGWKDDNYKDYRKGLTYACDVNAMKNILPNIPELHQTGILVGPNSVGLWNTVFAPDNSYRRTELRMG